MSKDRRFSQQWMGSLILAALAAALLATITICTTIYEIRSDQLDSREEIACMELGRTDCQ